MSKMHYPMIILKKNKIIRKINRFHRLLFRNLAIQHPQLLQFKVLRANEKQINARNKSGRAKILQLEAQKTITIYQKKLKGMLQLGHLYRLIPQLTR